MTAKELNRDIKRLASEEHRLTFANNDDYFAYIAGPFSTEFKRLFFADDEFKYMNLFSVRAMLRLNHKHRVIAFHHFGAKIEIFN